MQYMQTSALIPTGYLRLGARLLRAHLDTATGVRPSPGAAGSDYGGVPGRFGSGLLVDVAAPGDGSTPNQSQVVVVVSRCAPAILILALCEADAPFGVPPLGGTGHESRPKAKLQTS